MKVFVRGQGTVTLAPEDFVARGGQASVYAKGDVALKLFTDPDLMVPVGKLRELAAIDDPDVIRPEALIEDPKSGRAIGYTMRYLGSTRPLCQLVPPSFRSRHGIGPADVTRLVERLRALFEAVHRSGALVVDANDMNFLVDANYDRMFAIDTDSYQTRNYPATAVTPSILAPFAVDASGAAAFSTDSDWFAFAVLAFQLFVGAHPYRGGHPTVKSMSQRMAMRLSAFDARVSLPPTALGVGAIPAAYADYLKAVLQDGERGAPPRDLLTDVGATMRTPTRPRLDDGRPGALAIERVATFPAAVRSMLETRDGSVVVECEGELRSLDGRLLAKVASPIRALVLSPRFGRPIAAVHGSEGVVLRDLGTGLTLEPPGRIDDVTSGGGRLIARIADTLVELAIHEVGATAIVSPRVVGRVLPRATRLFEGVAYQSLLGAAYLSLLGVEGGYHQLRVPELDGARIVDARADRNVVVVVVASGERRDRAVIRISDRDGAYDLRWAHDVEAEVPDVVVLDTGICLMRSEGSKVEVFSCRPHSNSVRVLDDERLEGLRLARHGGSALAFSGDVVYRLSSSA